MLSSGAGIVRGVDLLTDEQLPRYALGVLKRELGADGLARFLRLHRSGAGDYRRERGGWQKGVTFDEAAALCGAVAFEGKWSHERNPVRH